MLFLKIMFMDVDNFCIPQNFLSPLQPSLKLPRTHQFAERQRLKSVGLEQQHCVRFENCSLFDDSRRSSISNAITISHYVKEQKECKNKKHFSYMTEKKIRFMKNIRDFIRLNFTLNILYPHTQSI
jgi:hypothetical protein